METQSPKGRVLNIPYNWTPDDHQREAMGNPARYKVLCWHRKARKTTVAVNELIRWCYAHRDTYWYVAPYYGQAKKIVWDDPNMLPRYCPPDVWDKRNNSEMKLTFPNGSVLYVLGADKPDSLRGPNPRGVVLDEYADMKSEVWSGIVQPIMIARTNGWTWFTGTPKGTNDFKAKFDYAKHSGDPKWWASRLKASESGIISADALEEAKRTTTAAFYSQEYETEFLDGAGQFFRRIRENVYARIDAPKIGRSQMGADLAKHNDFTVLTAVDLATLRAFPQERFNQVDWSLIKARTEAFWHRYGRGTMYADATGVGDPIVEDLAQRCHGVEPFVFTEKSRNDLLSNLAVKMEQDRIGIPDDEGLIAELQSFRYEMIGERGKTRIQVPEGCHDDRVMSLALAAWQLPDKPMGQRIYRPPAVQRAFDKFSPI